MKLPSQNRRRTTTQQLYFQFHIIWIITEADRSATDHLVTQ
jgi:hypothetical protein